MSGGAALFLTKTRAMSEASLACFCAGGSFCEGGGKPPTLQRVDLGQVRRAQLSLGYVFVTCGET
jgi:hypothetical protein